KESIGGVEPVIAAALPFEIAGISGHREAHAAFDRLDAEMIEQRGQLWIVHVVIDDEADVDRNPAAIIVDRDGVAVAAAAQFAIIARDRVPSRKRPGRGTAGNSRSDDRDAHSVIPRS